jgi:carbon storage regulator
VLVVTRAREEAIMIGESIEIRVLRVGRNVVRLGVTAPANIAVHRREVYDQICAQNRTAAESSETITDIAGRLRRVHDGRDARPPRRRAAR